jgi:hypothetical protein
VNRIFFQEPLAAWRFRARHRHRRSSLFGSVSFVALSSWYGVSASLCFTISRSDSQVMTISGEIFLIDYCELRLIHFLMAGRGVDDQCAFWLVRVGLHHDRAPEMDRFLNSFSINLVSRTISLWHCSGPGGPPLFCLMQHRPGMSLLSWYQFHSWCELHSCKLILLICWLLKHIYIYVYIECGDFCELTTFSLSDVLRIALMRNLCCIAVVL